MMYKDVLDHVSSACNITVLEIVSDLNDGITSFSIKFQFHENDAVREVEVAPASKDDSPYGEDEEIQFIVETMKLTVDYLKSQMN